MIKQNVGRVFPVKLHRVAEERFQVVAGIMLHRNVNHSFVHTVEPRYNLVLRVGVVARCNAPHFEIDVVIDHVAVFVPYDVAVPFENGGTRIVIAARQRGYGDGYDQNKQ